ncbi:MAG TPA: RHS repeat-associated core domain-containing protein, partial [Cyclobacteriaceae bacterium]
LAGNLQGIDYLYTADGALKSINHADPTKDPGQDGIGSTTFTADVFGMTLDYYTNDYVGANGEVENISMPETYTDQYSGLIKTMRWHSPVKSTKQFAYAYSYDERNQFINADWGIVTPDPTDPTKPHQLNVDPFKPYQEGVPDANGKQGYDANGNINFLQRNSNRLQSVNGFDYDLAYHYESNSNKLLNITNGDNTSLFRSYQYNGLGQMTTETKDDKTSYITYDVSGKVTGVYADVDHTQPITTYLYDDRGFRLSKTSYGTDFSPTLVTWYVRNASGDVLSTYEDNLDDDGVLPTEIPIYGSGRIGLYKPLFGNSFYELSDHLGNTRAVIGKVITNETLATMEDERSETESEQFINVNGVPSSFNHTLSVIEVDNQKIPLTSPGKVNRINNGVVGANPIGVGQWLPVEPGDVIEAEVYVKYADFQSNSYNPVTDALSQLETSFINHSVIDGVSVFTSAVTPVSVIVPASTDVDDDEPLAFLNYLLYDKHGNLVSHDNIQVSGDAEITADKPITFEHERLSFNLTMEQGGFLYVFVSNLTNENLDVYFDDLRIKQTMSNIVAGGDYYPYGLAIDDRQIDRQPFRYGYQGKNAEKDDETGWNHFELREYDPVVGRWTTADPKRIGFSPYIGMYNNLTGATDSDGGGPDDYIIHSTGLIEYVPTGNVDNFYYLTAENQLVTLAEGWQRNANGLMQLPQSFSFNQSGISFKFSVKEGQLDRAYVAPETAAALFGAFVETGFRDITINQFSFSNGASPSPSVSHINGKNGDLRYLKNDASGGSGTVFDFDFDKVRNSQLTEALYKFGWKDMKSFIVPFPYLNHGLLPRTSHLAKHDNHLHLQGFKPNIVKTKHPNAPIFYIYK